MLHVFAPHHSKLPLCRRRNRNQTINQRVKKGESVSKSNQHIGMLSNQTTPTFAKYEFQQVYSRQHIFALFAENVVFRCLLGKGVSV
jgi:hypothetical protein